MPAGRKSRELEVAREYLKHRMLTGFGEVLASKLIADSPVSERTLREAKKQMGLTAYKGADGWRWTSIKGLRGINPDGPKIKVVDPVQMPALEPEPEGTGGYEFCTADIVEAVKNRILEGWEDPAIVQEMVNGCKIYPMPHPYPRAYIESVVWHEIDGSQEVLKHLNKNDR